MKCNTKKETVLRKIYTGNDTEVDENFSVFAILSFRFFP